MTNFDKPYKNYDELLKILEDRNLDIVDKEKAKNLLQLHGYYSLINGYKESFLEKSGEKYKPGYNLDDIYSLYLIDSEMQELFLTSVLKVEKHLANTIGNVVAEHFGVDHRNSYLDYLKKPKPRASYHYSPSKNSYLTEENYCGDFKRKTLQNIISRIYYCTHNPILYYKNHHDHIPPWILVQNLTFGQIVNYYQIQKPKIKSEIVNEMITSVDNENMSKKKTLFYSEAQILSFFRNTAAHAAPIYLFKVDKHQKHFTQPSKEQLKFYLGENIFENSDELLMGENDLYAAFLSLLLLDRDSLQREMLITKLKSLEYNYKNTPVFSDDYKEYINKAGLPDNYIERLESANEHLEKNELSIKYKAMTINGEEHIIAEKTLKHPKNDFGAMKKVFIQDSTLYHVYKDCQYLKKEVKSIPFQEAVFKNLKLCKKCKLRASKQ